eukprot:TRINITY_DN73461_c0_g1_i1.p1 TRINITY_DN73461_c0_g1~~TRINITY_DN73461_c0_g1_i1.p1  ORF type:complete len:375 (+),score=42.67 TRINITY_DN73461_c0_g1_i1:89-1213(+)
MKLVTIVVFCWHLAAVPVLAQVKQVAWNANVPPNEASGPWRPWFRERDPRAEGMVRSPDDPGVVALRSHLERNNCMVGLETFSPRSVDYDVARAAEVFRRDGFVVLEDVLDGPLLHSLHNATGQIMSSIFAADPEGSFGGGAGKMPFRYSLGDASATKSNFHVPAYCDLIDLPTTTPLLMEIFGSIEYLAAGCGGDVALAGALEYQPLHPDAIWGDQSGRGPIEDMEVPPAVTVNFVIDNLTALNGPMRVVPGSHRWHNRPPSLHEETDEMLMSTLCPIPAGSAIVRDNRCWHGGTPNLSGNFRALPNMEYFPPGGPPSLGWLDRQTMPFERWEKLTPLGQYLARGVVADPGEKVAGAGKYSPAAILDIMPFLK